jgi:hypothetical protein
MYHARGRLDGCALARLLPGRPFRIPEKRTTNRGRYSWQSLLRYMARSRTVMTRVDCSEVTAKLSQDALRSSAEIRLRSRRARQSPPLIASLSQQCAPRFRSPDVQGEPEAERVDPLSCTEQANSALQLTSALNVAL